MSVVFGSSSRYRERSKPVHAQSVTCGYTTSQLYDPVIKQWVTYSVAPANAVIGTQRLYSYVEKCHDQLHWPGPPFFRGGPLDVVKGKDGGLFRAPFSSGSWVYSSGSRRHMYEGIWFPNWYPPAPFRLNGTDIFDGEFPDLSSLGPTAYQMYSPVKPKVDMGTFLGEIREMPVLIRGTAKRFADVWRQRGGHPTQFKPRALADNFLEYTFGWVPFLGTLLDFHKVTYNLAKHIRRVIDMNGKWERRGGPVDNGEIVDEQLIYNTSTATKTFPSISSVFNSTQGYTRIYKRTFRNVWFRGYFKYYIPHVKSPHDFWQPEILKMIFGLNISPALLWSITPWSWLIDWFTNISDILENARDADYFNLVSRNAFLMGTTTTRFDFQSQRRCGNVIHDKTWTSTYERKQRVPASPYGFDVDFSGLTASQIAILGALGFTSLPSYFLS